MTLDRNKFLLLLLIIIGVTVYFLLNIALNPLLFSLEQNNILRNKIDLSKTATTDLIPVKKRLKIIEEKIGNTNLDSLESQKILFNKVNDLLSVDRSINLVDISKPIINKSEDLEIGISTITVKGLFRNLLLFLDAIERSKDCGRVMSTTFTVRKSALRKDELHLIIYLQYIKSISK